MFFLIVPLFFLLSACATVTVTTPVTASQALFPLHTGAFWKYRLNDERRTIVENHVASAITLGDTTWFEMIEYGEHFWVRNTEQGQVEAVNLYSKRTDAAVFENLDANTIREELMFRFPAQKGENWITLENTVRYEGTETRTVPAGTFACHLYSIAQRGQVYSQSCIAEGVGVIYSKNLLEGGREEVSELVEWGKK